MKTRIITGVVAGALFAAVIALAVIFDSLILEIALILIGIMGVYEAVVSTGYVKSRFIAAICLIYAAVTPFVYSGYISVAHEVCLVALGLIILTAGMFMHKNVTPTAVTYAFSMTVIVTFCLWALANVFNSGDGHGLFYFILVFIVAWGCDTGAYFSGYFFGKHKMTPEISPKKTVEGAVGGVIFTMLIMWVACIVFGIMTDATANTLLLVAVTPVLSVAGMFGDLIASYIKRDCGIKDYGNVMPGHGGVLDRFDSVLAVIPLMYIIVSNGLAVL